MMVESEKRLLMRATIMVVIMDFRGGVEEASNADAARDKRRWEDE